MTPPSGPDAEPRPRRGPALALTALGVVTLLGFAAPFLPLGDPDALVARLSAWGQGPWAPLVGIFAFALLASLGVPQFVLITALVAVFGGWLGLGLSWAGKMIACSIGFMAGRVFGAGLVAQYASPALVRFMAALARHGFWVSAGIRLAPTVPSVLINIAAGATPIGYWPFITGAGVGSLPKMALMAFGGAAAIDALQTRSLEAWIGVGIALALFLALWLGVRWWRGRTG